MSTCPSCKCVPGTTPETNDELYRNSCLSVPFRCYNTCAHLVTLPTSNPATLETMFFVFHFFFFARSGLYVSYSEFIVQAKGSPGVHAPMRRKGWTQAWAQGKGKDPTPRAIMTRNRTTLVAWPEREVWMRAWSLSGQKRCLSNTGKAKVG